MVGTSTGGQTALAGVGILLIATFDKVEKGPKKYYASLGVKFVANVWGMVNLGVGA